MDGSKWYMYEQSNQIILVTLCKIMYSHDYLCRIWYKEKNTDRYPIIIQTGLRETVLKQCHDSIIGGHFGFRKTLEKVRQKYYWAELYKYVEQYVRGCDTCNRRKPPSRTDRAPIQFTGACFPMKKIAADILGPLPESENGIVILL